MQENREQGTETFVIEGRNAGISSFNYRLQKSDRF